LIIITKTELCRNASAIDDLLLTGQELVITSYGKAIGMITPEIPSEVRAKLKVRRPNEFTFKRI